MIKHYPNVPPGSPTCARSVVVDNLIFPSGMAGQDRETGKVTSNVLEEQIVMALDNLRVAMEEAGSSMNNIISTKMLLPDVKGYPRMRKTELEYYQKHAPLLVEDPPASTFIQPVSLTRPEYLFEIDAVGVVSRDKPGEEVKFYPEYWGGKKLGGHDVAPGYPRFSLTTVAGNLVFLSGSAGLDKEANKVVSNVLEEQMEVTLDGLRLAMEEAGSSMNNIIKTLILFPDPENYPSMLKTEMENYPSMRKAEMEYYKKYAPLLFEDPPASTFMQVAGLARREFEEPPLPAGVARLEYLVEIDAVGVISRDKPGQEVTFYPEYWGGKKLAGDHVAPEAPRFSRATVAGNLVFVSGCEALNPKTAKTETNVFEEQMVIALDKLRMGLEEAGSSMNNIIKTFMVLTDLKDYPQMRKLELEYYQKHAPLLVEQPPASTFIQVASLAMPEFLVEIDAIAAVSREK